MTPRAAPRAWSAADAERYLLSLELFGMRFGLERMRRLMTALDAPQERFDVIHVLGTNGKSSTTRMIARILHEHGLRTGAYLSPHLLGFNERLRIDERDVSDEDFAAAVGRAARAAALVERAAADADPVTQFEALTAAAYSELARAGVQVAAIEAGLGGRYDATSVVRAPVTVLTNVGLEHTRWLGPTVTDIAREKLAVLAPAATLVVGELHPEAEAVAAEAATRAGARILRAPADAPAPAALGAFQRVNFSVALTAARAYLEHREGSTAGPADEAVARAGAAATVPGRFQVVGSAPECVLDGAHNPSGMAALVASLPDFLARRPLTALVSILDDKDAAAMLQALLPLCGNVVLTACSHPRALSPATLQSLARQLDGPPAEVVPGPGAALRRARELAGGGGVVLGTGSIYLVADLLREIGDAGGTR